MELPNFACKCVNINPYSGRGCEYRIFWMPKGLNPFKIQARFKLEFVSEFYN
jgi:hypothetical protein